MIRRCEVTLGVVLHHSAVVKTRTGPWPRPHHSCADFYGINSTISACLQVIYFIANEDTGTLVGRTALTSSLSKSALILGWSF